MGMSCRQLSGTARLSGYQMMVLEFGDKKMMVMMLNESKEGKQ